MTTPDSNLDAAGGEAGHLAPGPATDPEPAPAEVVADPLPPPPAPGPPAVADGALRSLDPRSITVARLGGWIFAGILGFVVSMPLGAILLFASSPGWVQVLLGGVWVAILLLLAFRAQLWPAVAHRHAFFRVDGDQIEIRRGVWWRKVITVPRSRVQHTDVAQGPIERRYGLGTLAVYTAGTQHARVDLHGLDHGTALAIRDHLLSGHRGDAV